MRLVWLLLLPVHCTWGVSTYNADFTTPLDLVYEADLLNANLTERVKTPPNNTWVLESQTNSSDATTVTTPQLPHGALNLSNGGDHCVLWLNRNFRAADYTIRFGLQPFSTSQGLNIVFFSTTALRSNHSGSADSEDIFALPLPPRRGNYPKYVTTHASRSTRAPNEKPVENLTFPYAIGCKLNILMTSLPGTIPVPSQTTACLTTVLGTTWSTKA